MTTKREGRELHPAEPIDIAIPPGETLWELINERPLSIPKLMADTGLGAEAIEKIVLGFTTITPDLAQRLENGTGTPARIWLRLQDDYSRALGQRRARLREGA